MNSDCSQGWADFHDGFTCSPLTSFTGSKKAIKFNWIFDTVFIIENYRGDGTKLQRFQT